jgi:membrane-associated phospholipid phosphatase
MVKDELNELVDYLKVMDDDENETYLKRYKSYDRNLIQVINATFLKKGIEVNELTHDVVKDVEDLVYKLKFYFQRPRPNQLAQYYKLKLFPYDTYSGHTPSYPSGHTLQAFVILTIIGNLHPKEYSFCKEMIDDIAYSRLYMGVHFPSDNDFAIQVGEEILKHPEFAKKYGI